MILGEWAVTDGWWMMDRRFDLKRGKGTCWFCSGLVLESLAPNQIV